MAVPRVKDSSQQALLYREQREERSPNPPRSFGSVGSFLGSALSARRRAIGGTTRAKAESRRQRERVRRHRLLSVRLHRAHCYAIRVRSLAGRRTVIGGQADLGKSSERHQVAALWLP